MTSQCAAVVLEKAGNEVEVAAEVLLAAHLCRGEGRYLGTRLCPEVRHERVACSLVVYLGVVLATHARAVRVARLPHSHK